MDGSSVTDLGQFWARRGIELYMCSNIGLSGWTERRNRTRPGYRLPESLFPPLTVPHPPPRFAELPRTRPAEL
ncbi:hypothetical protein N7485_001337 [Penicillium canescens]|nr:hypothetical protein N7485_001337 [Penicillium canescens]